MCPEGGMHCCVIKWRWLCGWRRCEKGGVLCEPWPLFAFWIAASATRGIQGAESNPPSCYPNSQSSQRPTVFTPPLLCGHLRPSACSMLVFASSLILYYVLMYSVMCV